MQPDNQLLRTLADPTSVAGLAVGGWELLLAQARMAGLTARLSYRIEDATTLTVLPPRVRTQFAAARAAAEGRRRALEWEVNRLHHVLTGTGYPMLLLKGAAYAVAALPLARGRASADIDIMVPRDQLDRVEKHLLAHGWEPVELDLYDARYYRRWSQSCRQCTTAIAAACSMCIIRSCRPPPDYVLIRRCSGARPCRSRTARWRSARLIWPCTWRCICFKTARSREGSAT